MAYYRVVSANTGLEHEQFAEIFQEFDFTCFKDECNFFCPECRNMLKCSAYSEFRDEWESFYT